MRTYANPRGMARKNAQKRGETGRCGETASVWSGLPRSGLAQSGLVWHDLVWSVTVLSDLARSGLVWFGVEFCTFSPV